MALQVLLRRRHEHSSSVTTSQITTFGLNGSGFNFLLSVLMKYVSFSFGYRDSSFFGSVKYCVSDDGLLFDSAAVRTPASWLARAKLEIVKHTKNR